MTRASLPRGRALALALLGATLLGAGACDRQNRPLERRQLVAGGDPEIGKSRFGHYGCISCHTIPGVDGAHGKVGPTLAAWAGRRFVAGVEPNEPGMLIRFVLDPQSVAPGTAMPNVGVTETDARHMAAYLYTLH
jgi:cytochrome c